MIVDTGAGGGYAEKFEQIYGFDPEVTLRESLTKVGTTPEDITDVIITHLHFDHGGGAAVRGEAGWRLMFPNAIHHVQQAQWEHALNPNPRDRASYFRERVEIIKEVNALELHDGGWTPAPGLDVSVFDGHTPGQQLPKFADGETTLFYCGDLIPMSAHIPIPYVMAYDLHPVLSMTEKTQIVERAAADGWILFFEHDPKIEACRVSYDGKRFAPGDPVEI
jgi:glyoxylase-like metal-dependent hydrolase (beta-lactamase superfamily II)